MPTVVLSENNFFHPQLLTKGQLVIPAKHMSDESITGKKRHEKQFIAYMHKISDEQKFFQA